MPVAASHSRTDLSQDEVRSVRPSGEKAIEETSPVCPTKRRSSAPVATSHRMRTLSGEATVKTCLPSGEKRQKATILEWPSLTTNLGAVDVSGLSMVGGGGGGSSLFGSGCCAATETQITQSERPDSSL